MRTRENSQVAGDGLLFQGQPDVFFHQEMLVLVMSARLARTRAR